MRTLTSLWFVLLVGCGGSSMTGADAGVRCDTKTCNPGELCAQVTNSSGVCMPKNGAACPAGNFETTCAGGVPGCVQRSTTYTCTVKPADCTGAVDCACAVPTICPGAGCACSMASETNVGCVCQGP
ncbi:MAG: hypothetical protein U1E65_32770 [Myxococcota bacterium]